MNSPFQIRGVDVSSQDGTDGPQCRAETSEHHRGLLEGLGRFHQEVSSADCQHLAPLLKLVMNYNALVRVAIPPRQTCNGTEFRPGEWK